VLSFIDNILNDQSVCVDNVKAFLDRLPIRQSMENSGDHYIARMASQLHSFLDATYARLSRRINLKKPPLKSARQRYKYNFGSTDDTPICQDNQGVCIVELKYGFRPRMADGAYCRFCFARRVRTVYTRNVFDDRQFPMTLNPVQFLTGVEGEYADSFMFTRMLRKPKGSTGQEMVASSYDDLSDGDGKFYGIVGGYPNMDIAEDYDVVTVRVTRPSGPTSTKTIVVKGLREKSHCFHNNRLPAWINDYSQI